MSEQRSETTHHIPGVRLWLRRGWQDFSQTPWISMGFSSLFLIISLLAYWQLLKQDLGLILYPFITGFMVVAPLLVTGFQRVGRLLHEGQKPRFMDLITGVKESTPGIFFLTFVLCLCYLIWVTDAMVIYGMYFGVKAVPVSAELLTDPALRDSLFHYLLFTGLMGMVIALMGFMVGAFSIPLIMHQRVSFVSAVFTSVATVWGNKLLMLRWALSLALIMLTTLLFALPLLVIVLPVTAYASYEAYVDLLEP
ncbi:DUF2189 domain-containing protein [Amphritea sp. HPY]|uniref:DUF2189 domain-containing protein n=1 Tax=Amphritea sp. HPY TaxID=3421652 RepID=UPI003D7ECF2B